MLMDFSKLIEEIKRLRPEPVDDMGFLADLDRKNSLRVKLIACGFAWNLTEEEVQALLHEHRPLHSRNLWEFTLKQAFRCGLSYEEWWAFHKELMARQTGWEEQIQPVSSGKITMAAVKAYIDGNGGATFKETMAFTEELEQAVKTAQKQSGNNAWDPELLESVIRENLEKFAVPRTRTRLYFMRELYLYMSWVLELISDAFDTGDFEYVRALAGRYFQCKTALIIPPEKQALLEVLQEEKFVPAALAQDFDWCYGALLSFGTGEAVYAAAESASYFHKQEIAWKIGVNSAGAVVRDPDQLEEKLKTAAVEQIKKNELDERWAERYFRDLIAGRQEVSRELLLLFLLFVWCTAGKCEKKNLTRDKINWILTRSGFPELCKDHALDDMVISALKERKELESVGPQLETVIKSALVGHVGGDALYHLYQKEEQSILGQRLKRAVTRDLVEHEHAFLEKLRAKSPLLQMGLAASMKPKEKKINQKDD